MTVVIAAIGFKHHAYHILGTSGWSHGIIQDRHIKCSVCQRIIQHIKGLDLHINTDIRKFCLHHICQLQTLRIIAVGNGMDR